MLAITNESIGYEEIVNSFEYETILMREDDDYQGDSYYLLRDGLRLGILVFGWGSCSGCDARQACCGLGELTALRDELHDSIKWFDNEDELRDYILGKTWETEWYYRRGVGTDFIQALMDWALTVDSRVVAPRKLLT